ncbi:MAG: GrpB family protein [Clostridia bacterium]|nr:GrpB family protein [Clostridia bacterium]
MIGLKKGELMICDHNTEWEIYASSIIHQLKHILGDYAVDIQHIGSTSIKNIKAKPIIDIAIGVNNFSESDIICNLLLTIGIYKSLGQPFENILLFSKDDEKGNRLANIQVVVHGKEQWNKHILFRDYMNSHADKAKEYENIKLKAIELFPNDVLSYSDYKSLFISDCIHQAKIERSEVTI